MREYEMMIILSTDVDERNLSTNMEKMLQVVSQQGGTIENVDIWGRRKLAYEINKQNEAIYVVVDMKADPATAKELDRQLGLNETVMRTKILRKDEK